MDQQKAKDAVEYLIGYIQELPTPHVSDVKLARWGVVGWTLRRIIETFDDGEATIAAMESEGGEG